MHILFGDLQQLLPGAAAPDEEPGVGQQSLGHHHSRSLRHTLRLQGFREGTHPSIGNHRYVQGAFDLADGLPVAGPDVVLRLLHPPTVHRQHRTPSLFQSTREIKAALEGSPDEPHFASDGHCRVGGHCANHLADQLRLFKQVCPVMTVLRDSLGTTCIAAFNNMSGSLAENCAISGRSEVQVLKP